MTFEAKNLKPQKLAYSIPLPADEFTSVYDDGERSDIVVFFAPDASDRWLLAWDAFHFFLDHPEKPETVNDAEYEVAFELVMILPDSDGGLIDWNKEELEEMRPGTEFLPSTYRVTVKFDWKVKPSAYLINYYHERLREAVSFKAMTDILSSRLGTLLDKELGFE